MMIRNLALCATLVALALVPATSWGHLRTQQGDWLVSPHSFKQPDNPPNKDTVPSLPFSVIFKGEGFDYTYDSVIRHVEADWTSENVPGQFAGAGDMRERDTGNCKTSRYAFFRLGNKARVGQPVDLGDTVSTSKGCRTQYHMRLWAAGDYHDRVQTDPAHDNDSFVLTDMHYETINLNPFSDDFHKRHRVDNPAQRGGPSHEIDAARRVAILAMREEHCIDRRWATREPSRDETYGDSENYSGIITRISLRHRDDSARGCSPNQP